MQLFLDANIYLEYFRENSNERLTPLKELAELVEKNKLALLIPQQTQGEYYKNRRQIAEKTKAILKKQSKPEFKLPALIDADRQEAKNVKNKIDALERACKEFIDKYEVTVKNEKTDADIAIKKLFEVGKILEDTDEILTKAHRRYLRGYPPRKNDHSYGDAIAWETLLTYAKDDELVIITRDSDFLEIHGTDYALHSFLEREWKANGKKKIRLFRSLAEFIKTDFSKESKITKEIVDQEKAKVISSPLFVSGSLSSMVVSPTGPFGSISGVVINPTGPFGGPIPLSSQSIAGVYELPGEVYFNSIDSVKFCPYCGEKVEEMVGFAPNQFFCTKCGKNSSVM